MPPILPAVAGPGPALRLTREIRRPREGVPPTVDVGLVEKVCLPRPRGCRDLWCRTGRCAPTSAIREWLRSRIIGQREAIEAVVQMITLFKAGLHDAQRPIGSFLFMGPTGVGKTELARALAAYLFGSEKRLLRFDLSELKDYHSFQMLIGDPDRPERPVRLGDPVRAQPLQIVLLDEIEKAHSNVWDLLLQLLDDGQLTPVRGPAVSFRNTIIIATTNAGAGARLTGVRWASPATAPRAMRNACRRSWSRCSGRSSRTASSTSCASCA